MTQFEYISVAIALVFSLLVTKLISGSTHAGSSERGSWIVLLWAFAMLIGAVTAWWTFWRFRDVDWTAFRFLWVLGSPALLYLRATVLLTDSPSEVTAWDSHFFKVRRLFFVVGLIQAAHTSLAPWVYGLAPWLTPAPAHAWALVAAGTWTLGLLFSARPVQLALAGVFLVVNFVGLLFTPPT